MKVMTFSPLRKQWDLVVLCHDVDRGIDLNGKAASQIGWILDNPGLLMSGCVIDLTGGAVP